jgi:hypothetical protein
MYAWKNTEFKRISEKRDIESSIKSIFPSVHMRMENKMQSFVSENATLWKRSYVPICV